MFDAYFDLPAWLRTIIALGVLGLGMSMTFTGYTGRPTEREETRADGRVVTVETGGDRGSAALFRGGMVTSVVGAVLLLMCGKTDAEKRGYNF